MTGTADTEAEEFAKIYNLDVVVIPPNRTLRRVENPDLVYRTEKEKWMRSSRRSSASTPRAALSLSARSRSRNRKSFRRCSTGAA